MLQDANIWLQQQRKAFLAVDATIKSGAYTTAVKATMGSKVFRFAGPDLGEQVQIEARDFLIDVADYKVNGVQVEPAVGHKILWVQDGQTYTYGVQNIGDEPCAEYSDRYLKAWRVHTQLESVA